MNAELQTSSLLAMLARHRAGDRRALDDLIRRTSQRLKRLVRKMLGQFPAVRAREVSGDVLQSALIRLTRALGDVTPNSVREYYGLAAEQIRRELLDLARRHALRPTGRLLKTELARPGDSADLARWAALQEAVEKLPTDLREVFSLTFYHGWTQAKIAELLQMSDRQVRRLWVEACQRLSAAVEGDLPNE